jgi:PPOX class probable F420-dependent enzyme
VSDRARAGEVPPGPGEPSTLGRLERRFLDGVRRGVLATTRMDGRPRLVPVCFALLGDALVIPLDEKPKREVDALRLGRVRDILARPAVSVLVDRWEEDWTRLAWLRLDGTARVLLPGEGAATDVERGAAFIALRARYPQYRGHHLEARPLIRIDVERVASWGPLG